MIHWTDHMIVRANPPRVNAPERNRIYWFSTPDGIVQGRLLDITPNFVSLDDGSGNSTVHRAAHVSIYDQQPNPLARMGITRPY